MSFPCTHFVLHNCFCFQSVFLVSISNSAHTFQNNSKTLNTVKPGNLPLVIFLSHNSPSSLSYGRISH